MSCSIIVRSVFVLDDDKLTMVSKRVCVAMVHEVKNHISGVKQQIEMKIILCLHRCCIKLCYHFFKL